MKIVTAAQMKSLDQQATVVYKIPSLLLMENAARGLVDQIEAVYGAGRGKQITIVAGRGNNGGDGLAAARHLKMRGAEVVIYLLSPIDRISGDARVSLDIWRATDGALFVEGGFSLPHLVEDLSESDLVIDALLGTGLSHPVTGVYADVIGLINEHGERGRTIVSVDIPSGISADTGETLGVAVKADLTLTMALPKWGHFLQSGLEHRGDLAVIDIGIPPALITQMEIKANLVTPGSLKNVLPVRLKGLHKGTMGHLQVIAGSLGKRGASQMTAMAAMKSGTGLVTLALPRSLDLSAPAAMECMTLPLPESSEGTLALSAEKNILDVLVGKNAVAMGPGLSRHPETQALVRNLITQITIPMVLDADGLNAIADDLAILKQKKGPLILTPHPGEMARLIGKRASEVQKDRVNIASEFAKTWGVILVLKGANTLIAAPDGTLRVNNTGNPGMATAGIGDVLTGMISAFLAQGIAPLDAATLGTHLHGVAGDLAAGEKGEAGLLASDLIEKIPDALKLHLSTKEIRATKIISPALTGNT